MSRIKYILYPGTIISKSDGQKHYVAAEQLSDLYDVPLSDCIVVQPHRLESYRGMKEEGRIKLYPQYNKEDYDRIREEIHATQKR